jgi:hypothetical protein
VPRRSIAEQREGRKQAKKRKSNGDEERGLEALRHRLHPWTGASRDRVGPGYRDGREDRQPERAADVERAVDESSGEARFAVGDVGQRRDLGRDEGGAEPGAED